LNRNRLESIIWTLIFAGVVMIVAGATGFLLGTRATGYAWYVIAEVGLVLSGAALMAERFLFMPPTMPKKAKLRIRMGSACMVAGAGLALLGLPAIVYPKASLLSWSLLLGGPVLIAVGYRVQKHMDTLTEVIDSERERQ